MLPVIAGVEGLVLTPRERELFSRLQPAGYILFTRNIADYELTRELTDELRRLTTGPDEPIIAIDQEGGRVVRTAEIGVQLPSAAALAQKGSSHLIRQAAYYNAACLHTLGVNTNFAPVLDLASPHANALPSRCWGYDTQSVISHAGVWNRATFGRGIQTCGKHFPGMGAAECDPHHDLPVLHGTRDSFLREASMPFTALMPELPSLMIAHLLIPEIDAELPTSLPRRWCRVSCATSWAMKAWYLQMTCAWAPSPSGTHPQNPQRSPCVRAAICPSSATMPWSTSMP